MYFTDLLLYSITCSCSGWKESPESVVPFYGHIKPCKRPLFTKLHDRSHWMFISQSLKEEKNTATSVTWLRVLNKRVNWFHLLLHFQRLMSHENNTHEWHSSLLLHSRAVGNLFTNTRRWIKSWVKLRKKYMLIFNLTWNATLRF